MNYAKYKFCCKMHKKKTTSNQTRESVEIADIVSHCLPYMLKCTAKKTSASIYRPRRNVMNTRHTVPPFYKIKWFEATNHSFLCVDSDVRSICKLDTSRALETSGALHTTSVKTKTLFDPLYPSSHINVQKVLKPYNRTVSA